MASFDTLIRPDTLTLSSSAGSNRQNIYMEVKIQHEYTIINKPDDQKLHKWIATLSGEEYDHMKESQLLELAMESARDIVRRAIGACARLSRQGGDGPRWPLPQGFDENIVTAGQQKIWQRAAGIRR